MGKSTSEMVRFEMGRNDSFFLFRVLPLKMRSTSKGLKGRRGKRLMLSSTDTQREFPWNQRYAASGSKVTLRTGGERQSSVRCSYGKR
jgi:hypothetical protein